MRRATSTEPAVNNVRDEVEPLKQVLPPADIAAKAKGYTVLIECWK